MCAPVQPPSLEVLVALLFECFRRAIHFTGCQWAIREAKPKKGDCELGATRFGRSKCRRRDATRRYSARHEFRTGLSRVMSSTSHRPRRSWELRIESTVRVAPAVFSRVLPLIVVFLPLSGISVRLPQEVIFHGISTSCYL